MDKTAEWGITQRRKFCVATTASLAPIALDRVWAIPTNEKKALDRRMKAAKEEK